MRIRTIYMVLAFLITQIAIAGYDPTGDPNLCAWWRFENGALTTDSSGNSNTLTDEGTVTADTADYQEGSASADLDGTTDFLSIPYASLSAGFAPAAGKISICAWVKSNNIGTWRYPACQLDDANDTMVVGMTQSAAGLMGLVIGWNGGASREDISHATAIKANLWYHVGVTFNDTDKSYRIRVWDANASAILGSDKTGTATNNINIEACKWTIARREDVSGYWATNLDDILIFNDVLSSDEIDQIRAQTYGSEEEEPTGTSNKSGNKCGNKCGKLAGKQ